MLALRKINGTPATASLAAASAKSACKMAAPTAVEPGPAFKPDAGNATSASPGGRALSMTMSARLASVGRPRAAASD
jgi:hypothetical protein